MSKDSNPAATPTPCEDIQGDDSKGKEPDVLFVGDSLVQLLHEFEVWRKLFSPLHTLNFGVGGDATQHVLWRLVNGELDHISPKICGGIMAIINVIHQKLPHAHTLVLGVLPRGKNPNPLRERNAGVNALVQAEAASLSHVSFLDVDPGFVHSDGSISHQDMYDYLHLTPQGYQKVCQPLHECVKSLLDKHAP
ncbi:Platelet-activating factor acetylhydrolase IB subunit alpha2 [Labeo rohita]|uniref:Platelet-activating factor acetylhydrolase IB subunit alpha1 n=1 Tax=Labeo rohita TaxID=84645 RepID=A0ABQ8LXI6_LABRO|nr:Platelet-activating factor acetylhydrolase IB subunit alpha2 [Labeo rohita]